MNETICTIAGRRVLQGELLDRPDLISLARDAVDNGPWDLIHQAHQIRKANFANKVRFCSIVPGRLGGCSEDCKWCAQSGPGAPGVIPTTHTPKDEILQAFRDAAYIGSARIGIVNSGRTPSQGDLDKVIEAANDCDAPIHVCASLGLLDENKVQRLVESNVDRYHCNLETSRRFFPNVVTKHTYDEKLATLKLAREAGLNLCCGGLFGLGETWEDRIDLALAVRDDVMADTVPINFLNPMEGTALGEQPKLQPLECLTIIALFRLAMPTADLKVAGGREACLRSLQPLLFQAGGTSIMTGNYLTTAGQSTEDDLKLIADLEMTIVDNF
ncbi:MAG: biotin synthase BioB [Phycisphaerales bacterium]|jgi:biotin synthase|nr:biotin synthase BioB [Phycisphaerales bacterium]